MNNATMEYEHYAQEHSSTGPAYLRELADETQRNVAHPQMLSGHLQGRFLSMISKLAKPRTILEIGTYTCYSALCLAEGLAPGGKLHTIDVDNSLREIREHYIAKAGMQDRIELHTGEALALIKDIPGPIDLVFIDADKQNYPKYYEKVVGRVRQGGLIMADNLFWGGKAMGPTDGQDEDTRALVEYADSLLKDDRVEVLLLPLRDGLHIARKK